MTTTTNRLSSEVRERAVEHASQWAAIPSIAPKFGYNPDTLRNWVQQAERDVRGSGKMPGANHLGGLKWTQFFGTTRLDRKRKGKRLSNAKWTGKTTRTPRSPR